MAHADDVTELLLPGARPLIAVLEEHKLSVWLNGNNVLVGWWHDPFGATKARARGLGWRVSDETIKGTTVDELRALVRPDDREFQP